MSLKTNYIAYKTILIKEIARIFSIWLQALFPPIITMTLYFIIFGRLIGPQLHSIHGYSYIQYITPGLIIMPVITAAYSNAVSSFFMAKFQRHIEEILVSPASNVAILLGYVSGGVFRAFIISAIVTIIALFFTHLHIQHFSLSIGILFLTAVLFALIGLLNGIFAKVFDDMLFVPNFLLTPLTYLGGIFYSINTLPKFWRDVSLFNPIFHIINAFRFGFLGIADINVFAAFIVIIVFIIFFFLLDLYLLNKGVGIRS